MVSADGGWLGGLQMRKGLPRGLGRRRWYETSRPDLEATRILTFGGPSCLLVQQNLNHFTGLLSHLGEMVLNPVLCNGWPGIFDARRACGMRRFGRYRRTRGAAGRCGVVGGRRWHHGKRPEAPWRVNRWAGRRSGLERRIDSPGDLAFVAL